MDKPDDKGFLSRWSARKAEARAKAEDAAQAPAPVEAEADLPVPVDPAELPSIEDLTEDSDYTVFLRKGVPDAMRKAALRKLWVTEPSVVNYRPLVEYAWHNNEPGFGPLLPTDNVEEMLKRIFSGSPEIPKEADEAGEAVATEAPDAEALPVPEVRAEMPVDARLPQQESAPAPEPIAAVSPRRRHGGALPS